jgi:hypothetical protein
MADAGLALQQWPLPAKMSRPAITTRMEQANDFISVRIPTRQIRAFVGIAVIAGPGQIQFNGWTTVLCSNDVVDLERQKAEALGKVAVFAAAARAVPNELTQVLTHYPPWRLIGTKGNLGLELHQLNESSQPPVFIQIMRFVGGECPLAGLFREIVEPRAIAGGQLQPQKEPSDITGDRLLLVERPGKYFSLICRFGSSRHTTILPPR